MKIVNSSPFRKLRVMLSKVEASQFIVHRKVKTVSRERITANRSGQIFIISLIFLAFVSILTTALFSRTAGFLRFGSNNLREDQARNLAEAGVDNALWQLNQTAGSYNGESDTALGALGTFSVTVTTKTSILKTVTATGYVPNSASPRAQRTIKLDVYVNSSQIAFRYAVQIGSGGLNMENSAKINNATVYTNGSITVGSGSQQTINGDAYAVGTISSPYPTVTGTKNPNASPQPLPDISQQVTDWKNTAQSNTTTCSPTCTISSATTIGPKKYVGNLNINNATVTITGPIWVAKDQSGNGGNLTASQGGTQVNLDESFGSNGTGIVVDGTISISQGASFNPTSVSNNPRGYIVVVTNSNSDNPAAISIGQSGANAVFYALNGTADLSQTASANTLVANKLHMQNSAALNYDTGLASASFTSGPGGSWQPKRGTYRFTTPP